MSTKAREALQALQLMALQHDGLPPDDIADIGRFGDIIKSALEGMGEPVGYVTMGHDDMPIWRTASDHSDLREGYSGWFRMPRVPLYAGPPLEET